MHRMSNDTEAEISTAPAYDAERFAVVALADDDPMATLGYPFAWQERDEVRGHGATHADCVAAIQRYAGTAQ
jgi:hypothetical protein